MEGIQEIARSYYEKASADEKNSITELFRKLDVNGDQKISLLEFKKSVSSWLSAEAVFEKLDTNGDGSLDFEEFVCLYYMEKKVDIRRQRTAAAENSQNKKEMEEVREIAKAHYRAGSPQLQELAYEFYRSMDSDGDGRVDLSEFLAFMRQEGYSYMNNPYFFRDLDVDGNGALDFSEVMTLYYIIKSGRPFCDACGLFIAGIFFSCAECFDNPGRSFHLCRDCYRKANCSHNHGGRAQFLDNYTLLQARRDPPIAHASGPNSNQASAPTNAIVPVHHDTNMYIHNSYPTSITYVVNPANAIVPASTNLNKCSIALRALEAALSIGAVSATLCSIL